MGAITEVWRKPFSCDAPGKIVCFALNYCDHATESVLDVDANELDPRRSAWVTPAPPVRRGVRARYARIVSLASRGAVVE